MTALLAGGINGRASAAECTQHPGLLAAQCWRCQPPTAIRHAQSRIVGLGDPNASEVLITCACGETFVGPRYLAAQALYTQHLPVALTAGNERVCVQPISGKASEPVYPMSGQCDVYGCEATVHLKDIYGGYQCATHGTVGIRKPVALDARDPEPSTAQSDEALFIAMFDAIRALADRGFRVPANALGPTGEKYLRKWAADRELEAHDSNDTGEAYLHVRVGEFSITATPSYGDRT